MIEIRYLEIIAVFFINLSGFWLAYWVYNTSRKEKLNQWFAIMTFFVVVWSDLAFLANGAEDVFLALIYYRANISFVSLSLVSLYYFFVLYFFEQKNKHPLLEQIVSCVGVSFATLSFYSDFFVANAVIRDWGAEAVFGNGNILFNFYALFVSFFIIYFSVKTYLHLSGERKLRVQYFSVGIFFFILFNVIFNIFFPIITGTVEYARFGDYSAIILLAFTAYAITKNNLMGVKGFIAQIIIGVMSILLTVDILFLSNSINTQALKTAMLLIFLYYSRELIAGVKKEKNAREKLEKVNNDLKERNLDLKVLLDASEKVGRELDSRKISQDIVDSIPESLKPLGCNIGVIVLYSLKKDCVYVYAVTDSALTRKAELEMGVSVKSFREHLSESNDLIIKTIKNKKIYVGSRLEDFFGGFLDQGGNKKLQKVVGAKSFVSVPLFANGQVVGAIVFAGEKSADSVTKRNKDILKAFSSHIGAAIENAMLYEKTDSQMKELSKLNRSLKKANIKLKELLEVKNEFLHITSHQLRTPLTAIRGMIAMWIDGDFDKFSKTRRAEMLQRIYNSTERLNNLTNDMLDALELEGGVLQFEFKKVSVVDMIKDTVATLDQEYKEKKLYLKFEEPVGKIPAIEAEPNYMAQVFMNLIDNACKYTKEGGTKIKVARSGDYVNVFIEDTGVGIKDEDQERIFEKFTRGENAIIENASGSGLGLFIVRKIVNEHNGKIKLTKGAGGKGTLFKVSLPFKQE